MADRDRLIRVIEVGQRVNVLTWSPDGTRLAVGCESASNNVCVVTAEGRELWRATPFDNAVYGLDWSPDSSRLAVGCRDGPVVVLGAGTGTEVRRIGVRHTGGVVWSPNSTLLAIAGHQSDNSAIVFIIEFLSGAVVAHFPLTAESARGLDWSPDGSRLAVGRVSSPAHILDARSGQSLVALAPTSAAVGGVIRWAPNSTRVAFAEQSSGVGVADAGTGEQQVLFTGHVQEVNSVAWSPDGRSVASGGDDQFVRLWNPDTGVEQARFPRHLERVWSVAFAPDARVLASGSYDGTVRLWDVSDLCGPPVRKPAAVAAPDGAYLVRQLATVGLRPAGATGPAGLDLWVPTRLTGADPTTRCLGLIAGAHHLTMDLFPDGRHLFGGLKGGNRWAKWDLTTGRPVEEFEGPMVDSAYSAIVAPVSSRLAVANNDLGGIWVSLPSGPLTRSTNPLFSMLSGASGEWSPDGRRLAWGTFGADGMRVVNTDTGEQLVELGPRIRSRYWHSVSWRSDGRAIAAGRNDYPGYLVVWEGDEFALRWQQQLSQKVTAIRFAPDGRRLASGCENGRVTIWDADTGQLLNELRAAGLPIHRFAWSHDGRLLAFTTGDINSGAEVDSGDGVLRVWDVNAGTEVWWCEGLSKRRPGLAWAAGGGFLAAGCDDGVRLFDVRHLMTRTEHPAPTAGAAAAPVPPNLRALPSALAAVHRAGRYPPLSVLADLLALVAGRPPADPALLPLSADPGVARLAGLRWPVAAHPALTALLLAELPTEPEWVPPTTLPPSKLRRVLGDALKESESVPTVAPPIVGRGLASAAGRVTAGVAAALVAVGPAACALDPSLPLRLAARPVPPTRRPPPRRGGLASASGGASGAGPATQGGGRAGATNFGPPHAVAPWQWALPPTVLGARARRGELVYRAAPADPPVPARPAVVVLDTSTSASGAAGGVLRAAAAAVLRTALAAGGAALVSAGGGWSGPVRSEAELAWAWTAALRPGRAGATEALATAGRWRAGLGSSAVLVVLAGPWFGSSEPGVVKALVGAGGPSGARGAFAGPPDWSGHPALASNLLRWVAAPADRLPPPHDLLALLLA